jgi:hypothetical protein
MYQRQGSNYRNDYRDRPDNNNYNSSRSSAYDNRPPTRIDRPMSSSIPNTTSQTADKFDYFSSLPSRSTVSEV